MAGALDDWDGHWPTYYWPLRNDSEEAAGTFTLLMGGTTGFYAGMGALFVWLTVRRLRRKIFH